ncbi:integrase, catalytic region, zinc finger, CCHC-type containing protein [Tanacetum coccineum]|uniref:Integrase, catalytic region, zinc finger, CCHC-type containing protein n=1 Tax=Tanacetum coccineum TaxID=301880 RepID=A0ABQ4YE11_9ASTR
MLLMQAQDNVVVLDEEQLLFILGGQTNTFDDDVDEAPVQDLALNEDNVFQADQCDAFDSDVDEAPTAQTMFMANLSSADPVYDDAGPSYDSDIISEVQDYDNYLDSVGEYHEVHEMHNDAAQCVFINEQNKVVNVSLTTELARYKELVQWFYEKGQEKNKYLEEFLDMKEFQEKVEDKLYKQDQSLQTVHMLCKPKPYYDEKKKVAIGYKNPLYLTSAMQVQSALYNGHEIVKTNHAPAVVHDSEDTLELAEITRKRMLENVKSPLCVEKRVKIAPLDYSKENYLATFTPQRHLTLEQIFWSLDTQVLTPKPTSKMMVYPPNRPAKLVPIVLPTKSQVKINIYKLTQLFTEFDKTCKKRITPCGLTKGERGFEQIKECYLIEVIPFFKTLKEHFEGIQIALVKEVKEMKEIFEQMEAEVEQNVVDKQCADIERKNLLIENKNLIADCLSNELLYSVMNDNIELIEHVTTLQEQNERFRAENEKVKQHYKELYDSIKITRAKTIEKTASLLTEIEKLKAQLKGKMQCVTMPAVKPKVLAPGMYAIDVEPFPPRNRNNREVHLDYLKHLKESVETLRKIVEEARIEKPLDNALENACFYTKRSQELLEYVIDNCPKEFNKRDKKAATTPLNRKKQIVLWYLDSGCSKHMTENHSRLKNFMKKFIRTVRFGNDHFGAIMGYGDNVIDLEVSFRKHSCYVRDVDGVELLKGSRGSNLYTISVEDMMRSSPICLLSKASKNKSWLWHRRLNHLNFDTINDLARKDLVRGLPRLKFEKDYLFFACQLGKSKKYTHKPKSENTIMKVLHTLYMDL